MDAVSRLFPGTGNRRTTRAGIEHELLTRDSSTGAPVAIERVRAATSTDLSFEPGGQVELNQPCGTAPAVVRRLRKTVASLRANLASAGIALDASPVDDRTPDEVPLQLTSARYTAMQAHFDTVGPAGRRMMRCTASTQVCLDWWPGRAGLEQWRVLNLAGPRLAAAYARSVGPDSRLATWLAVDPERTAFDDRLLRGGDPVSAYADFARRATPFTGHDEHLSTLFPPVRPRGRYLEVRVLDVQPDERIDEVVGVLTRLMYDAGVRGRTLAELEPMAPRLGELWRAAADGDLDLPARAVARFETPGAPRRWRELVRT
jgi:glutamate--cysteine ligase